MHAALLKERADTTTSAALAQDLNAFDASIVAAAGIIDAGNPHNAWSLPANTTTSFRFLGDAFGKLANAADGADAEPSTDARAGIAVLQPKLDRALGDWSRLQTDQLAALNQQLRANGRKSLPTSGK